MKITKAQMLARIETGRELNADDPYNRASQAKMTQLDAEWNAIHAAVIRDCERREAEQSEIERMEKAETK